MMLYDVVGDGSAPNFAMRVLPDTTPDGVLIINIDYTIAILHPDSFVMVFQNKKRPTNANSSKAKVLPPPNS